MSFANNYKLSLLGQNNLLSGQFRIELKTDDFLPLMYSCCVLLVNLIAVGLLLVWSMAYIKLLLLDSRKVLPSNHLLLNHPSNHLLLNHHDTVQVRPKRRNILCHGNWKVHIVKIWH
jgi:hypothetical protein